MTNRATLLDSLLTDPSGADQVPREEALALLAELVALQAALITAASRTPAVASREVERPNEDRMLDIDEAAAMLSVSRRWLYRHGPKLPFTRPISRRIVRYSRAGIQRWLAARRI
jgi:predicted DNA-binding transcriptional regulator AlpA